MQVAWPIYPYKSFCSLASFWASLHFSFYTPQCDAKIKLSLLFFKISRMHIGPTLLFLLPLSTDCTDKLHKLHFSLNRGDTASSLDTGRCFYWWCLDNLVGGWMVSLGGSLFGEEGKSFFCFQIYNFAYFFK